MFSEKLEGFENSDSPEIEETVDFKNEEDIDLADSIEEEETTSDLAVEEEDIREADDEEIDAENSSVKNIYDLLEDDIMNSDLPMPEKIERLSRLIKVREKKVNIILVGATGSGKSSTVNALFNMEVAKVGVGVDPETDTITSYELENLTIWDTPGLGDGVKNDEAYNRMLVDKLSELDENGNPLIDLVLVVLDASSKDLGTSYDLINNIIIPCLEDDKSRRVIVGLNQADIAMKGKHWDSEKNEPDEVLLDYLKKKAESVRNRILEGTGLDIRPVFYSAGYKEEGGEQCKPYNLTKLLYYIIKAIPKDKRFALADNINPDVDNWLFDDEEKEYKEEIKRNIWSSIKTCVWLETDYGAYVGGEIGDKILGIPGKAVGIVIGGTCGAIKGFFEGLFG